MLGRGVLSRLHCLTEQDTETLTLYLDVDQNRQANRNRGYVVQAEALLKELRGRFADDDRLRTAAASAVDLVGKLEPQGKGAVVVVHPETGLQEAHQVRVGFAPTAHWRKGAFLRPVVEAMDEHERYAVVLTDSTKARLFTVHLGEITEHEDMFSATGRRTRATGADQWRSQKRQERHHDEEMVSHSKRVIDALHDLSVRAPFDRLIVAGPTKAAAQLVRLLPRRLRGKLVETISLPVTVPALKVLEGTLEVQQQMERRQEELLVEGLLAEVHDGGKAAVSIGDVVDVVNQGRVWKLVYGKEFTADGGECSRCGAFSAGGSGRCVLCGGELRSAPSFVDRLSQSVIDTGGRVEVVGGAAAEVLRPHGSIAALLRY